MSDQYFYQKWGKEIGPVSVEQFKELFSKKEIGKRQLARLSEGKDWRPLGELSIWKEISGETPATKGSLGKSKDIPIKKAPEPSSVVSPPPVPMSPWSILDEKNQTISGLTDEQIIAEFKIGKLNKDSLVWQQGWKNWEKLETTDIYLSLMGKKKCPFCAETVKADAVTCPFCQMAVNPPKRMSGGSRSCPRCGGKSNPKYSGCFLAFVCIILFPIGLLMLLAKNIYTCEVCGNRF